MAIVSMQKVRILAMLSDRTKLMELLMEQGITQIEDVSPEEIEEQYDAYLTKPEDGGEVAVLEADIKSVKEAIDISDRHVKVKKAMFAPRRKVTRQAFLDLEYSRQKLMDIAGQLIEKQRKLGSILSEKNRISGEIAGLERWSGLPFATGVTQTSKTNIITGILTTKRPFHDIMTEIEAEVPYSMIQSVFQTKDAYYIYAVYHQEVADVFLNLLANYEFSQVMLPKGEGVPVMIKQLESDLKHLDKTYEEVVEQIIGLAENKGTLELLHDFLSTQRAKQIALTKLASTQSVFMLKGWMPSGVVNEAAKAIESTFDSVVMQEETREDEKPPILLKNNRWVQPFEVITEMYSLPDPRGIDPNVIMAPFFFIFFGMMVSDAGYGLLMMFTIGYMLWKFKPEGQTEKFLKMLFWGGVSTAVWGAIFGGWFGDVFMILSGGKLDAPRLMDPLKDPISLLGLSFALGAIHLFVGMGAKAYLMIRQGDFWGAVFDIGLWYVVLIGLPLLLLGGTPGMVGNYMSIIGALGLVLTQGRSEKGILKKLLSGILSLYNITAYLGDVLSYSRLLALGLSTGVVASVVNAMGSMGGNNVIGWILFTVVFIGGHIFNILINVLGAYVHTSRLQYVEFFGKFYESGGKAFRPFRQEGKYVEVMKDAL